MPRPKCKIATLMGFLGYKNAANLIRILLNFVKDSHMGLLLQLELTNVYLQNHFKKNLNI